MQLPSADINWIKEKFSESFDRFHEAWLIAGAPDLSDEPSPRQLADAMDQLISLLYRIEDGNQQLNSATTEPGEPGLGELGNYGFSILENLSQLTIEMGFDEELYHWEPISVALALWVARQGGELTLISLVVNGLASLANDTMEAGQLDELFHLMGEISDAVSPAISEGVEADNRYNPWRLLLLNRAIVATRTLSPKLMEEAFDDVAEHLPEQAPEFFREGMEQVDIQNYPGPVRDVIKQFCDNWPTHRILH